MYLDKTKVHLLIDGNNLGYQAIYSVGEAYTDTPNMKKVYSAFISKIKNIYNGLYTMSPKTIICFDSRSSSEPRREVYEGYKANRVYNQPIIETLRYIQEQLENEDKIVLTQDRAEADDIIATLSRLVSTSIIVTADRDLLQCVDRSTFVYAVRPKEYLFYTRDVFVREYGFEPSNLPDYKALRGDQSDNIPGIPRIGDRTAKRLVSKYGSIDGLYQAMDNNEHINVHDDIFMSLIDLKEKIYLYKQVCTVDYNVEFDDPIQILDERDCMFRKDQF